MNLTTGRQDKYFCPVLWENNLTQEGTPKFTCQMSKRTKQSPLTTKPEPFALHLEPAYPSCSRTSVPSKESHSLNFGNNECQGVRAPSGWSRVMGSQAAEGVRSSVHFYVGLHPNQEPCWDSGQGSLSLEKLLSLARLGIVS